MVLVGVAAISLAACSSSGSNSSSGSSDGGSASSVPDKPSGLAAAQTFLDQYSTTATTLPITAPLKSRPVGKVLYAVANSTPVSIVTTQQIVIAGKKLGFTVKTINQGGTSQSAQQAWDAVVAAHPAAVIGEGGVETEVFKQQLGELHQMHVPVVLEASDQPAGYEGVLATTLNPSFLYLQGRLQAAYAAIHTQGKGGILYITVPEIAVLDDELNGFKTEMKQVCPSCQYDTRDFTVDQLGSVVPGEVLSYVQAHPDTKYVIAGFSDMFLGVPQRLSLGGFKNVHGIGEADTPPYTYLTSGFEVADAAVPVSYKAWYTSTLVSYALAGQALPNPVPDYPTIMLTKSDVEALQPGQFWPGVENYEALFEKIWGL